MKFKLAFFLIFSAFSAAEAAGQRNNSPESESVTAALLSAPFSAGVNFSQWFEVSSAQRINFKHYTEQDFIDVKSLGADVIRLPVKFHDMTSGTPDYLIDPLLLRFLDTAVDWAEKHKLYIIIDNHSFHPVIPTPVDIDKILIPVWSQIAQRYRNRSEYVIYEILNEPHGISDSRWGEIQGMAIDAIRRFDQNRWIIVGGTDYNSIGKLSALPLYTDKRLIYTFHFYDPFLFTHQGAGWGETPLTSLSGVPFPANPRRMPNVPSSLRGTWVEGGLRNYYNEAAPSRLRATLDRVVAFANQRNVPVFCGEFGVYIPNSPPQDRVTWYDFVANALDNRNISRTSWDYYGGFGIFNTQGKGDFNSDLNVGVVRAMGFTPPLQIPRKADSITEGFVLFDDYPGRNVHSGFWGDSDADFSLYETSAAEGEFAIRWGNAERYNTFWFNFPHSGDFSALASGGYFIEFKARTESPVQFDIRFINSEANSSIPWRMRYVIDEAVLPPDGRWHTIRIPLDKMTEHGAWINSTQTWLTPRNEFSWKNINRLEFVAEYSDLKGRRVLFDSIRITR